jgi:hypothetical protein
MSQTEPEDNDIPKYRWNPIKKVMLRYKKTRDKIVFCLNFLVLLSSISLAIYSPINYPYLNALTITVMLMHRIYEFILYKWEFYLIDICYFINVLTIIYTLFFSKSYTLFILSFGFSLGPIFFAIFIFRHAYVFHNTLKFTSCWTHVSPPLTMFLIRWFDHDAKYIGTEFLNDMTKDLSFLFHYIFVIFIFYCCWGLFYYVIQFKIFTGYIKKNKCDTQFDYTYHKHGTFVQKQCHLFGELNKELGFMYLHARWVMTMVLISLIFFFFYNIGLIILCFMLIVPIYFASTYYIDHFSEHYTKQFKYIQEGILPVPV